MKRFLCPEHSHHAYRVRETHKPIQLSKEKCSICRWENRPYTLKDLAGHLETVAANLRFAAEDEHYDPFGITYVKDLENTFEIWAGMIHADYRKNFFERIKKFMIEQEMPKP